jgi:hypothetical protein
LPLEDLTGARPEYQGFSASFRESEGGQTIVPDTLTYRWWQFLCAVSVTNILLWTLAAWGVSRELHGYQFKQLMLSGLFVAACAFRSILPRIDLERMCLWDSPFSSVFLGRSVATIAEICFALQCALLLFKLSHSTGAPIIGTIGLTVLPIIFIAELACWCAVVTLNHIGHAIEELLWSIMVVLVATGLVIYHEQTGGGLPLWVAIGLIASAGTTALIMFVDIPLYITRWRTGKRAGLRYLRIRDGLKDAFVRRHVTHASEDWRNDALWMSLYFSVGVWVSLVIVFV